jgi:hypothetical protein
MEQNQKNCTKMINDDIAVQVLDALREKTVHTQTQAKELTKKFKALVGDIEEVHKV